MMSEPKVLAGEPMLRFLIAEARDYIAALEARIAVLEPRAELGRLVEQMPIQSVLMHGSFYGTRPGRWWVLKPIADEWAGDCDNPADALHALVGEKDG